MTSFLRREIDESRMSTEQKAAFQRLKTEASVIPAQRRFSTAEIQQFLADANEIILGNPKPHPHLRVVGEDEPSQPVDLIDWDLVLGTAPQVRDVEPIELSVPEIEATPAEIEDASQPEVLLDDPVQTDGTAFETNADPILTDLERDVLQESLSERAPTPRRTINEDQTREFEAPRVVYVPESGRSPVVYPKLLIGMFAVVALCTIASALYVALRVDEIKLIVKDRGGSSIASSRFSDLVLSMDNFQETIRALFEKNSQNSFTLTRENMKLRRQVIAQNQSAALTLDAEGEVLSIIFQAITANETGGDYTLVSSAESFRKTPPRGPLAAGLYCKNSVFCDFAYGRYQVMGDNIPSWTKKYYGVSLTPDEWLQNPRAQDIVARGVMNEYRVESKTARMRYGNFLVVGARWHSPSGDYNSLGQDSLGTSTKAYVQALVRKICPIRPDLCNFPEPEWYALGQSAIMEVASK